MSAETLDSRKEKSFATRNQATNSCSTNQLREVNAGFNWKLGAGQQEEQPQWNGPTHINPSYMRVVNSGKKCR